MDAEEEPSWLSGLIDRADRLILTIGGYEEELFGNRFSDDESDSSEDDDNDSGFEDGDSPERPAREEVEEKVVPEREDEVPRDEVVIPAYSPISAAPHRDAGKGGLAEGASLEGVLEEPREGVASSGREGVVSSNADEPPGLSMNPLARKHDDVEEGGERFPEEVPQKREEALRVLRVSEGAATDAYDPMLRTPAHSRDRDVQKRGPPLVGHVLASGVVSRRVSRARKLSSGAGEAVGGSLNTEEPSEKGRPAEEAVHHPMSPTAPYPPNTSKTSARKGKKRFSYMGDTAWLRPTEEIEETTPAPQGLGAGVVTEARSLMLGTRASLPVEGSRGWQSLRGPDEGAGVVPHSSAGRDLTRSPRGGEDRFEKDAVAATYAAADTDSDAGRLSEDSLEKVAANHEVDEQYARKDAALGYPEEGVAAPSNFLENYLPEGVHEDDHDELYEEYGTVPEENGSVPQENGTVSQENGTAQEESGIPPGEREPEAAEHPGVREEGEATIGAKRASVENGVGPQEESKEEWILGPPEAFAPSKRGKTQPECLLAVMRHSSRLDDAIHERQRKLEAMSARKGTDGDLPEKECSKGSKVGLENGKNDDLAAVPWPDKALRPYDSPIVDTDLPARQAKELGLRGFGPETLIVCSPFRRCLQTAGVVARTLGVANVTVHLEVGERMDKVRKEIAELALANEREWDGTPGKQPVRTFSYLDEAAMNEALGAGVQLEGVLGKQPPEWESGVEAKERFIATIAQVRKEWLREGPVLLIAHGDTLDAAGESLASQIVFEANYCAWAVFDLEGDCGYVLESYGIQMIPL